MKLATTNGREQPEEARLRLQREALAMQRESLRYQKRAFFWQIVGLGFSSAFLYLWLTSRR